MTKIAAISLLVFMAAQIHVFAATAEDEIATEKLLDSRCQAGGGPSGTAWASCDARDVAIKELEKEGISRAAFDRVFAPMGLEIGAITPEEIAVSVVAEMIALRRAPDSEWRTAAKSIFASEASRAVLK